MYRRLPAILTGTMFSLATAAAAQDKASAPAAPAMVDGGSVADAGGPPESPEDLASAWIIPAGKDDALVSFLGDWWKAPSGGVKVEGLTVERDRVVLKVAAGKARGVVTVAHGEDPRPLPKGLSAIDRAATPGLSVGVSCEGCAAGDTASITAAATTFGATAGARRDGLWSGRPGPRTEPAPGTIENIPQGKTEEETKFTPAIEPDVTGTVALLADGGTASSRDIVVPTAQRPWGRYVLIASLIALLIWLLRAPAEDEKPKTPEAAASPDAGAAPGQADGVASAETPPVEPAAPVTPPGDDKKS